MSHEVRTSADPDEPRFERVTLASDDGVEAAFLPAAGMVGVSLTLDGVELLASRHGLEGYLEHGSTFGIPLLAPWANRLGAPSQQVDVTRWQVEAGAPGVHLDSFGQPIHGLVPGSITWVTRAVVADDDSARLGATWSFAPDNPRFASFPFPFDLDLEVVLAGRTLRITSTLSATTDVAVPVAFGWHPWFEFPDVPREQWDVSVPFRRSAVLGDTQIPTGEVRPVEARSGSLGSVVLDDVYVDADGAEVGVRAGDRGVTVRYVSGYPVGVVFAPAEAEVICVEPMTAPTDPFAGRFPLAEARRGAPYTAVFEIVAERF